jgi:hypothetical protein
MGDGRLVRAEPSGPTSYELSVGTSEYRYPTTTRWDYGDVTRQERGPQPIAVGKDPDPQAPRILDTPDRMKGEYMRAREFGASTSLEESVSWELTRTTAPCGAPPSVPPLPAESEPPEDGEP